MEKERVQVLLFGKEARIFDYWFPHHKFSCGEQKVSLPFGHRVRIPFRGKWRVGLLLDKAIHSSCLEKKLLEIDLILDDYPIFSKNIVDFIQYFSTWWFCSLGQTFSKALPSFLKHTRVVTDRSSFWRLSQKQDRELVWQRTRFKSLKSLNPVEPTGRVYDLLPAAASSGAIGAVNYPHATMPPQAFFGDWALRLTFYKEKIRQAQQRKESMILLFPDLQRLKRNAIEFREFKPLIYHAGRKLSERMLIWQKALSGENVLILGLASAIWLPFKEKVYLILDEEDSDLYRDLREPGVHLREVILAENAHTPRRFFRVYFGSVVASLELAYAIQQGAVQACSPPPRLPSGIRTFRISRDHLSLSGRFSPILLKRISSWLEKRRLVCIMASHSGSTNKLYCGECQEFFRCRHCHGISISESSHALSVCLRCHHSQPHEEHCPRCHRKWLPIGIGAVCLGQELSHFFKINDVLYEEEFLQSFIKELETSQESASGKIIILTMKQQQILERLKPAVVIFLGVDGALQSTFPGSEVKWMQCCMALFQRASISNELPPEMIFLTHYPEHPFLLALCSGDSQQCRDYLLSQRQQHQQAPHFHWVGLLFHCLYEDPGLWEVLGSLKQYLLKRLSSEKEIKILGPLKKALDRRVQIEAIALIFGSPCPRLTRKVLQIACTWLETSPRKRADAIEWDPMF